MTTTTATSPKISDAAVPVPQSSTPVLPQVRAPSGVGLPPSSTAIKTTSIALRILSYIGSALGVFLRWLASHFIPLPQAVQRVHASAMRNFPQNAWDEAVKAGGRTETTPVGLPNPSADCWINAAMQFILNNPDLLSAINATATQLQPLVDTVREYERLASSPPALHSTPLAPSQPPQLATSGAQGGSATPLVAPAASAPPPARSPLTWERFSRQRQPVDGRVALAASELMTLLLNSPQGRNALLTALPRPAPSTTLSQPPQLAVPEAQGSASATPLVAPAAGAPPPAPPPPLQQLATYVAGYQLDLEITNAERWMEIILNDRRLRQVLLDVALQPLVEFQHEYTELQRAMTGLQSWQAFVRERQSTHGHNLPVDTSKIRQFLCRLFPASINDHDQYDSNEALSLLMSLLFQLPSDAGVEVKSRLRLIGGTDTIEKTETEPQAGGVHIALPEKYGLTRPAPFSRENLGICLPVFSPFLEHEACRNLVFQVLRHANANDPSNISLEELGRTIEAAKQCLRELPSVIPSGVPSVVAAPSTATRGPVAPSNDVKALRVLEQLSDYVNATILNQAPSPQFDSLIQEYFSRDVGEQEAASNSREYDGQLYHLVHEQRQYRGDGPGQITVSLKRFGFRGRQSFKITKDIPVPLEFSLPPSAVVGGQSLPYELHSFIVHIGNINGGHYVSYVKRGGKWFCCDDTQVTVATDQQVQGALKQSYILDFRKKAGGSAASATAAATSV